MQHYVLANVFRYNPDTDKDPFFKEYKVPVEGQISVLMLLDRIYREQDQSLSFRSYCCGLQMCRSCLMKINQKRKFACLTLVAPGETVVIEPASFPWYHVKDLVVHIKEG
jgi:succinate dehydrogenase / fumarate reductase iron-sulfur subunit